MDTVSTIYLRPPVWALITAIVIGGLFYLAGKNIEVKHKEPVTISVSADAKVSAVPDIAELGFGVQTARMNSAKDAMTSLSKSMNGVIAAVKKLGVEEKDIKTTQLWLNPVYDYTDKGSIPRGFQASEQLQVKVRDLDKIGDVLSAATNAGANQSGGVNFTIDDMDGLRAQARTDAIAKAKAKARDLAGQLGLRLGKLKGFSEGGNEPFPRPVMMMKTMDSGEAPSSVPVPPGEQEIMTSVTLTYEVE